MEIQPNKLILTNSAMAKYSLCPRRYYWRYVRGFTSKGLNFNLEAGSYFHDALHKLFLGEEPCWEATDEDVITPADMKCRKEAIQLARFLIEQYMQFYGDRALFTGCEVTPEWEFQIDSWRDDVILAGKVDGLIRRKDGLHILEHKTTRAIDTDYLDKTRLDRQITFYMWAVRELTGELPKGIIYNVVGKPRKYRRKGESYADYLERQEVEYLTLPGTYFARQVALRTEGDFEEMELDMHRIVDEIASCHEEDYFRRNTDTCYLRERRCNYQPFCISGITAQNVLTYQKKDPFCELDEVNVWEEA